MVTVLRPLSTSEVLDRTFHLYRNNFFLFAGIAALPQVGVLAIRLADSALWMRMLVATLLGRTLLFLVAGFVALEISHAATVIAVSNLHLGRTTSIATAYSEARRSIFRVVGIASIAFVLPFVIALLVGLVSISVTIAILVASRGFAGAGGETWIRAAAVVLLFFAAPVLALRWWLAWSLVVPVTVIEGGGVRTSMRRSRCLTADRHAKIFVIYVLFALLTWTVNIVFQVPFYLMVPWHGFLHIGHASPGSLAYAAAARFLSTTLVAPLLTIAFTLVYYDERVRREGFDLQLMMSTLEGEARTANAALAS